MHSLIRVRITWPGITHICAKYKAENEEDAGYEENDPCFVLAELVGVEVNQSGHYRLHQGKLKIYTYKVINYIVIKATRVWLNHTSGHNLCFTAF
jgi:hypothetical protein